MSSTIRTYLPAEAECTRASLPATRNPVSSKCATPCASRALMIASIAGEMKAAIFLAATAITAGDGVQPKRIGHKPHNTTAGPP
jgi:hypothetical protein